MFYIYILLVSGREDRFDEKRKCEISASASAVQHMMLLSAPRYGSSFLMSLLANNPRVLYLGELFNADAPLAHANIVNNSSTQQVMKILDQSLPGDSVNSFDNGTLHNGTLQNNLKERINRHLNQTRDILEDFAVRNRFSTLLYKNFHEDIANQWLSDVITHRRIYLILLRRNFLQAAASFAFVKTPRGGFVRKKSFGQINLNFDQLHEDLATNMNKFVEYEKLLSSNSHGASAVVHYEEMLEIQNSKGSSAITTMLYRRLKEDAAFKSICTKNTLFRPKNTLFRRFPPTDPHTYQRQDTRDNLKDKVLNYLELKHRWPYECEKVEIELQFPPGMQCRLNLWSVPP